MVAKLTKKQKADLELAKLYKTWYAESVDSEGNVIQPALKKPPPPPILP